MRRALSAIAAILLAAAAAWAQDQPSDEQPVIRVSVDLVEVDAVVTGPDGKIVRGLGPGDFEILQDGRPQKIGPVSFVELASPPPGDATIARPGAAPTPGLRPDQVRRSITIVIDDLNLSHASVANVRRGLRKFVEKGIAPGTLICILRTGSGSGSLQSFTSDSRQLLAIIDNLNWNPRATAGVDPGTPPSAVRSTDSLGAVAASPASVEQEVTELARDMLGFGSVAAMEWALRGVRSLPGRKSLIVVTEGIALKVLSPFGTKTTRVFPRFQRLVLDAHRAGVVFYTIHPAGLQTGGSLAATGDEDALGYLASRTGGRFLRDRNFLENDLAEIAEDLSGYYLIGYRPPEGTFNKRTHKIEVRVRGGRRGMTVRSRSELLGVEPSAAASTAAERATGSRQLARALVSPFGSAGVPVRLTAIQMVDARGQTVVRCLLHIDAKAVQRVADTADASRVEFEVLSAGVDGEGRLHAINENRFEARLDAGQIAEAERAGFLYGVEYSVTKPGPYQIRVAVRDVASGRIGSASQFLEIPDRARSRMALSSVVLDRKRPGPAQTTEVDPLGNPAVRRYRPGDQVSYALQLLNPPRDTAAKLSSEVRLYREGVVVFQGRRDPVDLGGGAAAANAAVVPLGGTLSLGRSMPAGTYAAEFRVISEAGRRVTQAAQWQDFTIE